MLVALMASNARFLSSDSSSVEGNSTTSRGTPPYQSSKLRRARCKSTCNRQHAQRLVDSHPLPHEEASPDGITNKAPPPPALQRSSHLALVEVLHQLVHLGPRPQRHGEANVAALGPLLQVSQGGRSGGSTTIGTTTGCILGPSRPPQQRAWHRTPQQSGTHKQGRGAGGGRSGPHNQHHGYKSTHLPTSMCVLAGTGKNIEAHKVLPCRPRA